MGSLRGLISNAFVRLMGARYGYPPLDKLKLLVLGLLSSFPTTFKRLRSAI